MCGIAGIWRKHSPLGQSDLADVASMMRAIVHRGPDDSGTWSNGRLAFGHQRLAIIDTSRKARQPMQVQSGDGVLIFNGEVYNFHALRAELRAEGIAFQTACDTEVVLNALHHWGPRKAIPLFNGMFAIAYVDLRTGDLWLARDRLGIKPLSVAETSERILFASEDKALLACDGFDRTVDKREIMLRLASQYRDSGFSLFDSIERVPSGGLWRIDGSGIEKSIFWDPIGSVNVDRIINDYGTDAEHHDRLEALLQQSIDLHCIADTAIASACSSGVDSGVITVLSKRRRPDLHAYVVDPQMGRSEAEGAELTARAAGVELRRVPFGRAQMFDLWPQMVWHLESDGWHGSRVALLALAQQCRADGVKVLLTGEGADELFGGYPFQAKRTRQWRPISPPFDRLLPRRLIASRLRKGGQDPFSPSWGGPNADRINPLRRALSPELGFLPKRLFDHLQPVASLSDRAFLAGCIYDLYAHLGDLLNRHDRMSMAASVELRVPFIENAMIDFALHLPRRFKHRRGTGKWLLKKVAERYVPKSNIYARKNGFGISSDLSAGAERILINGPLREVLKWPAASVTDMIGLAAQDPGSRMRLVGMDLFLRLYAERETTENLSEKLHAAAGAD
ncbi:asparagine synthase (glutamine-hydrolyzing) [Pseudohoeflea coraliihabitans]|uniref:asparagine synthase (glutamine-hydrolyzing) n=1 Tax=Pseudohoeflea coraliihabitans TaxID=2860393 RepID=A0ABS6WNA7_9HYPH|nr:asparagine synthase (glutamine-hydrolyzing) [Pseudohoeflea sp. DP4N28-3]MBW3097408.1 asparagine synthase (glutamine-hydrolyzing) [Pseudohoeflea sp. DP4N28-3]